MTSEYKEEFQALLQKQGEKKFFIRKNNQTFKISLFLEKAKGSFNIVESLRANKQIKKVFLNYWIITISYYAMLYAAKAAIQSKGYETDDHYATQIALGYLLVPDQLEKEDLELLNQAHKIFENEYVEYFDDARKESSTARYSAIKTYTEERVHHILKNAQKFIAK